jgi:hypothetical protein
MAWSWPAVAAASAGFADAVDGGNAKSACWARVPIARTRALNAAFGDGFSVAAAALEPTIIATPATTQQSLRRDCTPAVQRSFSLTHAKRGRRWRTGLEPATTGTTTRGSTN